MSENIKIKEKQKILHLLMILKESIELFQNNEFYDIIDDLIINIAKELIFHVIKILNNFK